MSIKKEELESILNNSECLISEQRIVAAYEKLAVTLNIHYSDLNPIVLVVLNGGLIPAGHLFTRLSFFHRMDYIHATRYHENKGGSEVFWKAKPKLDIKGEHILLIDDIFDEGATLKQTVQELKKQNPASIKTCVLLDKVHNRKVEGFKPDFIGTEVEDRYIYGCGMDYSGYLRHLPGIYALKIDK